MEATVERLKKLGLQSAAKKITDNVVLCRKLHKAYQEYQFIKEEDVESFNAHLRKTTETGDSYRIEYDKLAFIKLNEYAETPPSEVLDLLEGAIKDKCFDAFEVCKIESVREVVDPILFGRVKGCGDRFYVAQWDNDVTIEEIKKIAEKKGGK